MSGKIKLICNPVAGNHAVGKKWTEINSTLNRVIGDFQFDFTKSVDDATALARTALSEGYETVVALGGDGTINEVVNGFFDKGKPVNSEAKLGIIPMGTGSDLAKTLDTPESLEAAAERIRDYKSIKSDVGLVRCTREDGGQANRYFVNVADAGFGGDLAGLVNRSTKAMGSLLSYLVGLLRVLVNYQNKIVRIRIDDTLLGERRVNSVVVANGQFFGGGMRIAPTARLDDGLFDVIIIGDVNRKEVLSNIPRIYRGTLARHAKATYLRGKKVSLQSDSEVRIEADGELPGKLPATFENLQGALNVIC